jgi:hypothetical protein
LRRSNILGAENQKKIFTIKGREQGGVIALEIERQGQSPEGIWTLNTNPRTVSGNEYRRIFHIN